LPVHKRKKKAEKTTTKKTNKQVVVLHPHITQARAGPWVKCEPCGGHPCVQLFLRPTAPSLL